jgi:hypothetical protein
VDASPAGFHRVVEVAKMAVALRARNVAFTLFQKEEILAKLQGTDYLGVLPDHISAGYCEDLFPPKDGIKDFVNPWHDPELAAFVREKAMWYPVEELQTAV